MKVKTVPWAEIETGVVLPRRYMVERAANEGWRLGELADIASGTYVKRYCSSSARGVRPYLRVDNVRQFLPNLNPEDVAFVNEADVPGLQRVSVAEGDVVIARTGTLGKAFVIDGSLEGAVLSQHLTRLRLRPNPPIDASVLAAFLNSPEGNARVHALAGGSTRLELTHDQLSALQVPRTAAHIVPPVTALEISKLFTQMRRAFGEAVNECEALCAIPSAEMSGCQVFWARNPIELRISALPRYFYPPWVTAEERLRQRFDCVRLGDVAEVFRGAGTRSSEYRAAGLPFLMPSSLINGSVEAFPEHWGDEATYQGHGQYVGEGDLLLSIEGKIGLVALLSRGDRCLVKNHIEVIRLLPGAEISPEFLYAFLSSSVGRCQVARRTTVQATIPGLGSASRDLLIPRRPKEAGRALDFERQVERVKKAVRAANAARVDLRDSLVNLASVVTASSALTP